MSQIGKNLTEVMSDIKKACKDYGRNVDDVTLIAVSKGHDFSSIEAAYRAGQKDFGESYALEMSQKMALAKLHNLKEIRWHFLGAVQSNKLKIIKNADVIHSVSSIRHAQLLSDITDKTLNIFLQINLDQNPARQGFFYSDVISSLEKIFTYPNLNVVGFMTILPQDPNIPTKSWFKKMAELKALVVKKKLLNSVFLSMGMSQDFVEAIFFGANYVRIGTRIFGARN